MNHDILARLPGALLPWYAVSARDLPWRADREPYHVWLSEIMLQQTRVEAVRGYYARFLDALHDIAALAAAPEEQLLKLWEGLGYYSRVRQLGRAAREIMAKHGGVFPCDYDAIRALPGIGDYTAGAVASICFGQPTPAVDGNVLRVVSRICADDACIDLPATKAAYRDALAAVYPDGRCGDFTQALMELGATVCIPRGEPRCADCPCAAFCAAHLNGNPDDYPVRAAKRARRVEQRTVFLLRCEGRLALLRRPPTGLLAGLWELPNCMPHLTADEAMRQADEWGCAPLAVSEPIEKTHIFTHVEWQMRAYPIDCAAAMPPFVWASEDELASVYALPSAFRLFV
ncbi:MAG: A/G-specific adenine glycosylase [Clostridia bacterium]|nr:A/G-specific adenine glycosylase [Clostridia bacterium]